MPKPWQSLQTVVAMSLLSLPLLACEPVLTAPVSAAPPSDSRPNIVLIVAEDVGLRIGAYGDDLAVTPNIDRLAREGSRFSRAFTTAGVCSPSRAALITGIHQNVWGAGHMRAARGGYAAAPPPHVKAFPELLRAAGYYTINNGKTDYQMGLRFGGAYGGPVTLWDDGDTLDWSARSPRQPFFAWVNLLETHESQVWPTWALPDGLLPLILWPVRIWNHLHWPLRTDPARVSVPPYYPDTPTVRSDLARHYNNIAAMDLAVGKLLQRIEDEDLVRDTVVIFMSDHGDGFPRAKRWLYDSGIQVPLIVRWPGVIPAGKERPRLVSAIDLAPTILSIAGVEAPGWLQGRVFVGPREEPAAGYVYAARDRIDGQSDTVRSVRDTRYKYIRHYHPEQPYVLESAFRDQMPMMKELLRLNREGRLSEVAAQWFRPSRDAEELFDTENDPHEVVNLAGDPRHAATVSRLRVELDAWLAQDEDLGFLPEEELRRRFFPDAEQPVTVAPSLAIENGKLVATAVGGASVEFRRDGGPWRLYSSPFSLAGVTKISARAQRYGWELSEVVTLELGAAAE